MAGHGNFGRLLRNLRKQQEGLDMLTDIEGTIKSIALRRTRKPSRDGFYEHAILCIRRKEGGLTRLTFWPTMWAEHGAWILGCFRNEYPIGFLATQDPDIWGWIAISRIPEKEEV